MSKEPVSAKRIGMALGILGVFVWILFIFHSSDGFSKMGTIGEGWGALFIGVVVSFLCLFVLGLLIGWIVSGLRSAWSQDKRMVFTIIYCGLVALLLLIVPWRTHYDRSFSRWEGYSFVFSPPSNLATIDYGQVFLEFLCITAIFAIPYIISKWKGRK